MIQQIFKAVLNKNNNPLLNNLSKGQLTKNSQEIIGQEFIIYMEIISNNNSHLIAVMVQTFGAHFSESKFQEKNNLNSWKKRNK